MKKTYKIDVDCANCANKMEDAAKCTAANRKSSARTRSPRHRPTADSCHRRSWRTAAGSADYSVPFGRASGA